MASPKPFEFRVGGKSMGWRAIVNGKVVDLGDSSISEADAQSKLDRIAAPKGPTIGEIAEKVANPTKDEAPKKDIEPKETPKPGEFRKNGLAELSPALLKKFRETFAAAASDMNYNADKAMFAIFGYDVEDIPEESKLLLKVGWELACQQWFVDGVPPPFVVILFANAQIVIKLAGTARDKNARPKREENAADDKRNLKPDA
jgi:hypothetical protein